MVGFLQRFFWSFSRLFKLVFILLLAFLLGFLYGFALISLKEFKLVVVGSLLNLHSAAFCRHITILQSSLNQGELSLFEDKVFGIVSFAIKSFSEVLCWIFVVWVFYEFLIAEGFEFFPVSFIYFQMGKSIIMKRLWTFEYDRERVAAAKIVIDLSFIVHVVSKVGDLSRGCPKGSLFNCYYTKV